jgi:hypothetical protein
MATLWPTERQRRFARSVNAAFLHSELIRPHFQIATSLTKYKAIHFI